MLLFMVATYFGLLACDWRPHQVRLAQCKLHWWVTQNQMRRYAVPL